MTCTFYRTLHPKNAINKRCGFALKRVDLVERSGTDDDVMSAMQKCRSTGYGKLIYWRVSLGKSWPDSIGACTTLDTVP